jgi:Fic family protein
MPTTIAPSFTETTGGPRERSDSGTSSAIERVRAEYLKMPGLSLTLSQAARLWGLTASHSTRVLSVLVESGFLRSDGRGLYRRRQ